MRRTTFILLFILFGCIAALATARGSYRSEKKGEDAVADSSAGAVTHDPGRAVFSMDIKDEPHREVLKRLSDQSNITFSLPPSLGEDKVMMRFSNLTAEECLDKILDPYNRIFIYKEDRATSQFPVRRLTEVRIFPHRYEGRVREPLMKIAEGDAAMKGGDRVQSSRKDTPAKGDVFKKREETTYMEDLTTAMRGRDREAKLDAVESLRDASTVDALRALSFGIRDRDPQVQQKAVDALKKVGEDLVVDAEPGDDSQDTTTEGSGYEDTQPQEGKVELTMASFSGNVAPAMLNNGIEVGSAQFTVKGANITEVRTTERTEGFFATFNEKNGRVLLVNPSGETIAPGSGPIAEVVCASGGSVQITEQVIADKYGNRIK